MLNTVSHPDSDEPAGFSAPGFPKKLAVGENVSVYFSAKGPKRWVEESDLYWFGFSNTFGRSHWCSRPNAKKFRADVIEDFDAVPPAAPGWLDKCKTACVRFQAWTAKRPKAAVAAFKKRWRSTS